MRESTRSEKRSRSLTGKSEDAFRTIGEVAESLDLPPHVLRFWETRFSEIEPVKRAGGRRYYRPRDVELVAAIRHLLYGRGYTIKGVQRLLREQGVRAVIESARGPGAEQSAHGPDPHEAAPPDLGPSLFSYAEAQTEAESEREAEEVIVSPLEDAEDERETATRLVALTPREPPPMLTLPAVRLSETPALGLRPQDERRLRQALDDLTECRRMLELTRR